MAINLNFGGGRNGPARQPNPSAPEWYRRVNGNPWEALSGISHIGNDVDQIDSLILTVQSGAFRPNVRHNPYRRVLTSGRILTFRWAVNQSSHTIDVWEIRLQGKTNTALLMKF